MAGKKKQQNLESLHKEAQKALSCINTKIPKDVLNDVDKKINNLV